MAKPVAAKIKKAEGDALRALIDARIASGQFTSYQNFAAQSKVPGGKSMLSFNLRAQRPITPDGAVLYAKTLGCAVRDFSPRVADLLIYTSDKLSPIDIESISQHSRILVNQLCDLAKQIHNDGLRDLIGQAKQLVKSHPFRANANKAAS